MRASLKAAAFGLRERIQAVGAPCVIVALWLASTAAHAQPGGVAAAARPAAAGASLDETDQQAAVRAAFRAAEEMQGPLNGLWRLQDQSGRTLYILSLADAGQGPAPLAASPDHPAVEGAWRDPARPGKRDASGFIDVVRRARSRVAMRFANEPGRRLDTLSLKAGPDGRWRGQLTKGGSRISVVMTRF